MDSIRASIRPSARGCGPKRSRQSTLCQHAKTPVFHPISPAWTCRSKSRGEDFENLVADLVGRTETTLRQVVQAASLDWRDVNRILLVGGATRMPMVSEMIWRLTGKRPETTLSPDEAVARGAAIYAGMLLQTVAVLGTGSTSTGECELAQSGHCRSGREDEDGW